MLIARIVECCALVLFLAALAWLFMRYKHDVDARLRLIELKIDVLVRDKLASEQ